MYININSYINNIKQLLYIYDSELRMQVVEVYDSAQKLARVEGQTAIIGFRLDIKGRHGPTTRTKGVPVNLFPLNHSECYENLDLYQNGIYIYIITI